MVDSVKICGIPHKITLHEDSFDMDTHFGQINYGSCEIKLNKNLPKDAMEETLVHEILHGIFVHLGYNDEASNEQFVQALANAINQTFTLREEMSDTVKSRFLQDLPLYHFDRDDFCKVFREVFTNDEIIDIDVMCGYPQNTENFLLYRWEDEFYIIHRDSGTIINWYKHLGRTNTCNKEGFTLADLKELLLLLKEDLKEEFNEK